MSTPSQPKDLHFGPLLGLRRWDYLMVKAVRKLMTAPVAGVGVFKSALRMNDLAARGPSMCKYELAANLK